MNLYKLYQILLNCQYIAASTLNCIACSYLSRASQVAISHHYKEINNIFTKIYMYYKKQIPQPLTNVASQYLRVQEAAIFSLFSYYKYKSKFLWSRFEHTLYNILIITPYKFANFIVYVLQL